MGWAIGWGCRLPPRPSGLPPHLGVSTLPTMTTGPLQPLPLPPHSASLQSLPPLPEPLPLPPSAGSITSSHPAGMPPPLRGLPCAPSPTASHSDCRPLSLPTWMWVSLGHMVLESRAACSPECPQHPAWCQHVWLLRQVEGCGREAREGALGLYACR